MRNYHCLSAVLILSLFKESFAQFDDDVSLPDWDYLMYTQRWPISACVDWETKNKNNQCNLPKDPNIWVVHGLWPTKTGTDGPNDCNSAMHFDPGQLQTFMDDMNNYWTNIEAKTKTYSFWAHEWTKHGTCASILPQLDSVYNYFKKGLQLNREYDLMKILSDSNIVPNMNNYTIDDISEAIQKSLNKTAQIQCIVDSKTKESLISEIRLCFDKSFELLDCTSLGLELSNCSKKKPIRYLKDVPENTKDESVNVFFIDPQEIISKEEMLHEWYILIKFLIWFTL